MQFSSLAAGLALLTPLAVTGVVQAHKNGIVALGCDGCHTGGNQPAVTLTASPQNPALGQAVTLTVTVSETNGPAAGFYLTTATPVGTFKAIQAGTAVSGSGVTHTMPHIGSGGLTTFQAQWSAGTATGVQFLAFVLSANNDGTPRGDAGNAASLSITSGCAGTSYYLDQDADGYGTSDPAYPAVKDCAMPMGYAAVSGDCDDFHASVHPGAPELCDGVDNNCDGRIDEGLTDQLTCEDKDGDGHGVPGRSTRMGCAPSAGFGDCGGDCNDNNATVYPGAAEICDGLDNNCDGRTDEGVRVTCGVGWCRAYAAGCSSVCTPGQPLVETCNLFDDDCDGVVDNGTDLELCGAPGLRCVDGNCLPDTLDAGPVVGSDAGPDGPAAVADAAVGDAPRVPGVDGSGSGGGGPTTSPSAVVAGCAVAPRGRVADVFGAAPLWIVATCGARRRRKAGPPAFKPTRPA